MFIFTLCLIAVLLVLFVVYLPAESIPNEVVRSAQLKFKKYSGVQPDLYLQYVNNLQLCDNTLENPEMASYHLSNALENMRDLALYIPQYDLDEDIKSVAEQIEAIILKEALRTKKNFITVYVSSNEY